MTKPKLVPGLDEAKYHADTRTLSASGAKVLLGRRPPSPDSDALRFGTLFHRCVLEPHRLDEYAVLDPTVIGLLKDGNPASSPTSTAAWKTACADAEKAGKTVILPADLDRAQAMAAAVVEHRDASRIIAMATDYELSAYADHPTGARVRARFDLAGPIIGDLKTSRNADPKVFGRTAYDLGYHLSAAHYLEVARLCGMDPVGFAFLNVEHQPTLSGQYRVSVTELAPAAIELGRQQMHEACLRWLALGKRIDLPSYGDGFHTVDLPPWAYQEVEARALDLAG